MVTNYTYESSSVASWKLFIQKKHTEGKDKDFLILDRFINTKIYIQREHNFSIEYRPFRVVSFRIQILTT
jgi:hypothetical protein